MNYARFLLALLALGLASDDAHADGGIIRAREVQGPFIVTIFTASEPQQDNPVDVSVMVQEQDSSEAILDADVNLIFTPPVSSVPEPIDAVCSQTAAHLNEFTVQATRKQASNKLLYAAQVNFDSAGLWKLQTFIKRNDESEKIACSIPVSPPPRKLIALFPYLILPPLLVALFAVNQWLRRN